MTFLIIWAVLLGLIAFVVSWIAVAEYLQYADSWGRGLGIAWLILSTSGAIAALIYGATKLPWAGTT